MTSRPFYRPLLVSAILAAASVAAIAQPAAGSPPEGQGRPHAPRMHHAKMDPAKMQERMHKRQAELKAKLQLSPGQEAAWNSFVDALRPAEPPQRMTREEREKRHAEFAAMTTPQRLDQMQASKARRDARMQQRADATRSFYAVLTPAQQKVFDENMLHGRHGGGQRHGPDGHSRG